MERGLAIIDGIVNQDVYVDILAKEFYPWFTELTKKESGPFLLQGDGATFIQVDMLDGGKKAT